MIVVLPIVVFFVALAGAYLRDGWLRVAATVGLLLATAGSLALVTDVRVGASWLIGPALATLVVSRGHHAGRLTFEALTRRAITLVTAGLIAVFAATKFPLGENPGLLGAVPWLLGSVGAAWLISPIDVRERAQGQVLLVAAGAALLIAASPVGAFTAAVAGAMALLPAIASRFVLPPRGQWIAGAIALAAAAVVAVVALLPGTLPHPAVRDLAFSLDGAALTAAALLLVIGVLAEPARAWLVLPALVAALAVAPSLRWAALAALVAAQVPDEARGVRAAWLALLVLASTTLFAALTAQPWSPRAQIVGLATALVLMAVGFSARGSVLVLSTAALVILEDTSKANAALMGRFQWATAVGAVLLVALAVLSRREGTAAGSRFDQQVTLGLLLLAVGAHDPLGLGSLAVLLLLVDLALVRHQPAAAFAALERAQPMRWFLDLTGSGWPPTARFAGVTLAVIAALQTSLAWGLLGAALLIAIKLGPVIEPAVSPAVAPPRLPLRAFIAPAVALACGIAPALLLRMLRV